MRPDRRVVLGGIAALLASILAYQMVAGDGEGGTVPAPPPAPVGSPQPDLAPPPPAPSAEPASTPEGLRLHGITGAGAIIAMPNGVQRLVALGRDARPGLRLDSLHPDHVVLKSSGATYRLDFRGATAQAGAASSAAPPTPAAADGAETLRYRLGLAPRQVGQRVTSHVVRPGADMPVLARAGLRPGDVILRVNDSEFDSERMMELAWTVANSDQVVFEIERDGRRMRLATQGGTGR